MAQLEVAAISDLVDRLGQHPAGRLETQSLEIKSWCKNAKDLSHEIAEAAVCLSNAAGGMIIIGIDDKKTAPDAISACPYPFLTRDLIKKWIWDLTRPPVDCMVMTVGDVLPSSKGTACGELFVIAVQKTSLASGHRTSQGISYIRVDTECRPQYFAEQDDYSALPLESATFSDLSQSSLAAAIRHRETRYLSPAQVGLQPVDYLIGANLVRRVGGASVARTTVTPTVAALLFFGNDGPLKRTLPAAETVFVVEAPPLAPFTSSNWYNVHQALENGVGSINRCLSDRDAVLAENVLVELLLNAYLHRCYRTPGPVQIMIRDGELEIRNPGGLLGSLTPETVLYDTPQYRNFLLADAARQFGYCEKAGSGIDKVYHQLIVDGFDFPIFESGASSFRVTVRLRRDKAFARFIRDFAGGLSLKLTDLITIKALHTGRATRLADLVRLTQRSEEYMRDVLADLERRELVGRSVHGHYALTDEAASQMARYDDSGQLKLFG